MSETWIIGDRTTDHNKDADPGIYVIAPGPVPVTIAIVVDHESVRADKNAKLIAAAPVLRAAVELAYRRNTLAIQHARQNRVPALVLTAMAKEGEVFRAALQKAGPA